MASGRAEGESKLRSSYAGRGATLETLTEDEIGTPLAGAETDGITLKQPMDSFGELDRA